MSLEPLVLERIHHHKVAIFYEKLLIIIVTSISFITTVALVIYAYYIGYTSSVTSIKEDFTNGGALESFAIGFAMVFPIGI